MAITRTLTQITWNTGNNTQSCTAATGYSSDAISMPEAAFGATITVKADNNGTPASGDTVDVYARYTVGDPDAEPDSADEYDTVEHARYLGQLNTYASDTPGEDPAIKTFEVSAVVKGLYLYVYNNAASNGITVSAQMATKSG